MTRTEMIKLFPTFSPTRSFKKTFDGWELVGAFVNVSWVTNTWDVFVCNTADMRRDVGLRKLNPLWESIPQCDMKRLLDGEFYFQTKDINTVREWLEEHRRTLGLFRRRPPTNKTPFLLKKHALVARLAEVSNVAVQG